MTISFPAWMRRALLCAAVYNLLWGCFVILFPELPFRWAGLEEPNYPQIWQCVGMIVGVYGVGYAIAASNPLRHWPIVLVGLLGKIFGPLGFLYYATRGDLPWITGWTILANDLVWWIPFALILRSAYAEFLADAEAQPKQLPFRETIAGIRTNGGRTLQELSRESPVLVVFLRHSGCTFCREALADISERRQAIEANGTRIVLVHMSNDAAASRWMADYGLDDLDRISDPDRKVYRAFDLHRGRAWQLLGPRVWWRGFLAGVVSGHGLGRLDGDGFQMPGAFVLWKGAIVRAFRHRTAADRPDYEELVCDVPPVVSQPIFSK